MTGVLERRPNRRLPPRPDVRPGTGQEMTQSRRAFDHRHSRSGRCGYLVDEPALGAPLHTAQPTADSRRPDVGRSRCASSSRPRRPALRTGVMRRSPGRRDDGSPNQGAPPHSKVRAPIRRAGQASSSILARQNGDQPVDWRILTWHATSRWHADTCSASFSSPCSWPRPAPMATRQQVPMNAPLKPRLPRSIALIASM